MSEDGFTRITLRIPDDLHAKLAEEAKRTSKSMNAEIVARLQQTFDSIHDDKEFIGRSYQTYLAMRWTMFAGELDHEYKFLYDLEAQQDRDPAPDRAEVIVYQKQRLADLEKKIEEIQQKPEFREFAPRFYWPPDNDHRSVEHTQPARKRA